MDTERVFEKWQRGQNITDKINLYDLSDMPQFSEAKIQEIQKAADTDPDAAYGRLLEIVGFINTVTSARPDMLGKLVNLIKQVKIALQTIAEKKKADSFTISAGFPAGISISISWKTGQNKS